MTNNGEQVKLFLGDPARDRSLASRLLAKLSALLRLFYEVPWCVPAWGWGECLATIRALATGTVARGKAGEHFARRVRNYLGSSFALPVNRGRTAIEFALRAMSIGVGDEVVLPSYVCKTVLDPVLATGATPVFADVDETLNVTPSTVEAALTSRTKCVIVAHLYGRAAAIDEIERLLRARGIRLIDDAAQALGARCAGRLVGSFGDAGIVSCGPGKPLAGAAGGLLVTNDRVLFERAVALHLAQERSTDVARRTLHFWMWRRARRYTLPLRALLDVIGGPITEPPHVAAMLANLDAEIALAQFVRLCEHADERRRHAESLSERLRELGGKIVTDFSPDGMVVKLVYILPSTGMTALEAVTLLAQHGIEAQAGYSPLHWPNADDARLATTVALSPYVLTVPLETRPRRRVSPINIPVIPAAVRA